MSDTFKKYSSLIFFIAIVILVSACRNGNPAGSSEIVAKTPVTVTSPIVKDLTETVEFPAVSSYLVKSTIRSSTTGIVESVSITPGENVRTGTPLFTLKTREAAALQNASPGDSSLYIKGVIRIDSPRDGIISSITHQTGDFVQEGDELAVISDSKSLVFILEVPFESKSVADKNKECVLRLPDSMLIRGMIRRKLSEMNAQDQTVSYVVEPVSGLNLPQNLAASAILVSGTVKSATVLPREAVLGNETLSEFWIMKVINDSTAVKVKVNKGIGNRQEIEIKSPALLSGDRILRTGNYGLPDTAAISIGK